MIEYNLFPSIRVITMGEMQDSATVIQWVVGTYIWPPTAYLLGPCEGLRSTSSS